MAQLIDLTGKKFNKLTVIERAENNKSGQARWKCECDCGKEVAVTTTDLKSGHTKSCGCYGREKPKANFTDLTGRRFNRLTVIERAENNKFGQAFWKCKCDCGKETIVNTRDLKSGHTKSCGCFLKN